MAKRYLLGYDIGSSSVKAALVDTRDGRCISGAFYPGSEAPISSPQPGWAEQKPEDWWSYLREATAACLTRAASQTGLSAGSISAEIAAIGISYQMHGLVCLDGSGTPLRPSIIWCDSRAVPYGRKALEALGKDFCLEHLLGSPGNFTAAKLAWVRDNEPGLYSRIHRVMLPGDYIAYKLTGEQCTTVSGLSEGILWDFKEGRISSELLDFYGIDASLLPQLRPTFSEQGRVTSGAASELGIPAGIPVTYRAGDQPNNALSLNVFEPGEVAATAGTSGVVYGVSGEVASDPESRVNSFAHVNHGADSPRLGILLCINGTGILNSWIRRNIAPEGLGYPGMNELAAGVPVGCGGAGVLPFGNGAERMLGNRETGCRFYGVDFKRTGRAELMRAAQEGIVFSFKYGMDIMEGMGMKAGRIHAGNANMFLSPVFRQTLADVSGALIDLYDTDGAAGAARGAGMGAGIYAGHDEAFASLEKLGTVEPSTDNGAVMEAYYIWKNELAEVLAE